MPVMLGGEKAYQTLVKGDIVVSFQWLNGEPALFMWPKRPRVVGNRGAYCMPMSTMHQYLDPAYAAQQAITAAQVMGMDITRHTLFRIRDIFWESMQELKDMPPESIGLNKKQHKGIEVGEMAYKVDGKTVREETVYEPTIDELTAE